MANKLAYIEIKHLSGNQKEVAEVIGIEPYRKLVAYFGGERIAVSKPSSLFTPAVNADIIKEHNGDMIVARTLEISDKEYQKIMLGLK